MMSNSDERGRRGRTLLAAALACTMLASPAPALAAPTPSPAVPEDGEGIEVSSNEVTVLPGITVYVPTDGAEQVTFLQSAFTEMPLREGVTSARVASLQKRLMELEYFENDAVTSYYGPVTEFAVELFQRAHDLQVDGIAGEETLSLLYSEKAKVYTIYPGNIGLDVKYMQERLAELGYFKGKADGAYGKTTETAVRAFQKRNGLFEDAKMGTQSRDVLFSPNAKAALKPTPSSGGSSGGSGGGSSGGSGSGASRLVSVALGQVGDRYVWGATGPGSFDCSGLVYYSLRRAGVGVSRYNAAGFSQVSSWTRIRSIGALRRGDLIFFRSDSSSRVSHTAIYLGGGRIVHASSSRGRVVVGTLGSWGYRNFVCGRRVF
jgi:cell wall-associated NlpC family hydrolase